MIHKLNDGFVISSHGVWLPGVYESKRAARYAFRFMGKELEGLQSEKNKTTSIITFEDLKNIRKPTKDGNNNFR